MAPSPPPTSETRCCCVGPGGWHRSRRVHPAGHAHGVDDLGVPLAGAGHGAARLQGADELPARAAGEDLGEEGQATRTTAPSSAVMPIQKWKAKQIVR